MLLTILYSLLLCIQPAVVLALVGPPTLLYNVYENSDHVCVNDCKTAALQVCSQDLSNLTTLLPGQPPAVLINIIVGNCSVTHVNPFYNQTGFTTKEQCNSNFTSLIGQTSIADDSSCSLRLGGILGNDADGQPTGQPVFAYMPVKTPSDGFRSNLDGLSPQGRQIVPDTLFGVDQSRCNKAPGSGPQSTANTSRRRDLVLRRTDIALHQTDSRNSLDKRDTVALALACTALAVGGTVLGLCLAAMKFLPVIYTPPIVWFAGPFCLASIVVAPVGFVWCPVEAKKVLYPEIYDPNYWKTHNKTKREIGYSGPRPGTIRLAIDAGGRSSFGGRSRRTEIRALPQLDARLILNSDADYCNRTFLAAVQQENSCIASAFMNRCSSTSL